MSHGYVGPMIEISFGCDHGGCETSRSFRHDKIDHIRPGVDLLIRDGWLFVPNQALEKVECFCPVHAPARETLYKEQQAQRRAEDAERAQRRRLSWAAFDEANPELVGHRCNSGKDGECNWAKCPQLRDNEPEDPVAIARSIGTKMRLKRLEQTALFADDTRIHVVARCAGYRAAHVQSDNARGRIDFKESWNEGEPVPAIDTLPPEVAVELLRCLDSANRRLLLSGALGSIEQSPLGCETICGACLGCVALKSALRVAAEPYANDGFLRGLRELSDAPMKTCFDAIFSSEKMAALLAIASASRGTQAAFAGHADGLAGQPKHERAFAHSNTDVLVIRDGAIIASLGLVYARELLLKLMSIALPCRETRVLEGERPSIGRCARCGSACRTAEACLDCTDATRKAVTIAVGW